MLTLVPPAPVASRPPLDDDQRRVLADERGGLLVRGAPGTGKTTTALALVEQEVARADRPDGVLLVAPTRRTAARLRDELSARTGLTGGQPLVRTASSAAFSVLRARAALLGEPPPTLISGPEQDLVLGDLLAGHLEGEGAVVPWPGSVPTAALGLRAFRDELRDLLMRAAERGLGPRDLRRLGQREGRPEWVAAAAVYAEYLEVTRLRAGTPDIGARYDPAVVVDEAAEALRAWEQEVPGSPRPRWSLVVVDDYQEVTAATARLLGVLREDGARLVLLGDPDAAVQSFRGATPGLVERASLPLGSELGAFGAGELTLGSVWRHGAALRRVVREVTDEIRGPGRRHRSAAAVEQERPGGTGATSRAEVATAVLRSPAQEAAYVAYVLRDARLHHGLPWHRMAVVVRSGALLTELRRALLGAGVPVGVVGSELPLRAEAAVRPILWALEHVVQPEGLTAETAAALLTSPLGGLDAVGLRRLRRALRAEEIAGGGGRASDALLVEVLADPAHGSSLPATVRRPVVRLATVLAAGRRALADPGATVLDVLWALWSTAGLAAPWRQIALSGGPGGARADHDLDAVLTLFRAAEQFVDRMPQAPVAAFLEHLQSQDLPGDSLAAHGDAGDSVALLTPAGAAGGEWDLVVVAGVQEGVWPDLRLRDSMLGAQHLVEVLAGRAGRRAGVAAGDSTRSATAGGTGPTRDGTGESRAAVLDDELRSFAVAVSRARHRLVVTAVADTDHQPSPLLDLVDPDPAGEGPERRLVEVPAGLDLRSVVARCRAALEAAEDPGPDHPAAVLLARLAEEGVSGAHPDDWYGAGALSTAEPLWAEGATVPLSPSRLEAVSTCSLRWALEAAGGTAADSGEQSLGTLVHEIAATLPSGTRDELADLLDARWPELGLGEGWVAASRRRRADAMIEHLASYLKGADEAVAVEVPFSVQIGRVLLRGAVDRLERAPDGPDGSPRLRVVDLKTGRTPVSKADAVRHAQLGAYQAAVDAGAFSDLRTDTGIPADPASGGAALVYVGTTNRAPAAREQPALGDGDDPGWAGDLLEEVAATVSASAVQATTNDLCRTCPVSRSCPARPEGRVVGS